MGECPKQDLTAISIPPSYGGRSLFLGQNPPCQYLLGNYILLQGSFSHHHYLYWGLFLPEKLTLMIYREQSKVVHFFSLWTREKGGGGTESPGGENLGLVLGMLGTQAQAGGWVTGDWSHRFLFESDLRHKDSLIQDHRLHFLGKLLVFVTLWEKHEQKGKKYYRSILP